jgi:N6-adenosine-specific RNA methylase IME4
MDKTAEKKARRAQREAELAGKIRALPDRKYGVILADPEWRFEPWSRETGMDRAADNHYPTSPTEVIARRHVAGIAADDCVLYLWATAPMLTQALYVMQRWGFHYKTNAVWVKTKVGTGYWFRNTHELLLVGTKGNPVAPAPGTQLASAFTAVNTKHSEKPEVIYLMIEQLYPNVPKIELNRRGPAREGWDAWGNETDQ